jgi:hypothetical protein
MKTVDIKNVHEQVDKLVLSGELSVASGAKLTGMPYALYLGHLGTQGYSFSDENADIVGELALLNRHP